MELGLSLGEAPAAKAFFLGGRSGGSGKGSGGFGLELGFCVGLGRREDQVGGSGDGREKRRKSVVEEEEGDLGGKVCSSSDPPLRLGLLPFSQAARNPPAVCSGGSALLGLALQAENGISEGSNRRGVGLVDVNRRPSGEGMEEEEQAPSPSSPNSTVSSFQMDFSTYRTSSSGGGGGGGSHGEGGERAEAERASSRASDDEENGLARKKLRLTKEQSAYLEESFKEHSTLNPKQKIALAKQLTLRPRQVEVWFQNRRARTKLKQTEVDCEYLKRSCEKLREENRRLQKELQDLRTLKTSPPFYMQLPATTLTMCPSCERTTTTVNTNNSSSAPICPPPEKANEGSSKRNTTTSFSPGLPLRAKFHPVTPQQQQNQYPSAC